MSGRLKLPRDTVKALRPLTLEDMEIVHHGARRVATVRNLSDSHHRVARLLASGLRPGVVAQRCGYSNQRITTLQADPAFQNLVAEYRKDVHEEWKAEIDEFYDLASANMLKAERQIADRLDSADNGEVTVPLRELIAIRSDSADRFGYGKKQTNVNLNVDFASQLERARARSAKVQTLDLPSTSLASEVGAGDVGLAPSDHQHPSLPLIRRRA